MGKDHRGQPAGSNKNESATGIPQKLHPDDTKDNQQITGNYTEDEQRVAGHVREMHPNRNTSKSNATNAGGYKN